MTQHKGSTTYRDGQPPTTEKGPQALPMVPAAPLKTPVVTVDKSKAKARAPVVPVKAKSRRR